LLALISCAEINGCSPEVKAECTAWMDRSTPCWDLARVKGDESKQCHECEVYLSAWDHVLDESEKAEAINYVRAE
jgi:hypothetical protein